jgi:TolB protein
MFRRWLIRIAAPALAIVALAPGAAQAVLTIKITRGAEGALPIAVVPFGTPPGASAAPAPIAEIVADDLARTGRFAPVPFVDLPSRPSDASAINFRDWRPLGTGNLVIGKITSTGPDRYSVEFRLFDAFRGQQLTGYQLEASGADLRRTAHQISDIIYEELTGEPGAFDTRIAYVTETRLGGGRKRYALDVADSDGFNASTVLESAQPILSPTWSPDGGSLAYVSFERDRPRIFVQNVATGQRQEIAGYPGINGAPAFSPDGRQLALTLSKDGNPEIYLVDLRTRRLQRLTNNEAIDTEPSWSPDGQSLVFTSDRGGQPQLYRTTVAGGRAQRVTFEGRYNARGRFSPDGTKLALVHAEDGMFRIAVLDLENGALRVLTDATLDESPSFAPNGGMILYATTDRSGGALAAVSVDGTVRQRLAVEEGQVREPAWSPFRNR